MTANTKTKECLSDIQLSLLNDKFFMRESAKLSKQMLGLPLPINTVFSIVKEYTFKYTCLKNICPELASQFTGEVWWKTRENK